MDTAVTGSDLKNLYSLGPNPEFEISRMLRAGWLESSTVHVSTQGCLEMFRNHMEWLELTWVGLRTGRKWPKMTSSD